ncbi:hypothetical protein L107_13593 [Cyanobium sp. Copco_Reservoir_LC18]|jgi:hypothetical protein|uniref:hypothetical protein n=1 Tax=Cyanobium sp. Copco_Reservoir_LC18 TaxID=1328305 RepID=UPI001357BCA0|nr:hypothetical protein [Cyanobium sp. Copco_Reservoir_LC18]KAF0652459.1 hypothetical protein L107_13593 [Cyanobium sp. Copco_Reservoir_LC18]
MASGCFPHQFEGSFSAFKERQLVFALTRQLADAQFRRGDRSRSERLWQEAAAEAMDAERITGLLYGVHDHEDEEAMEAVDRPYRERQREALRRASGPLARLARLTGRRTARTSPPHRPAESGRRPLAGFGR